MDRETLFNAFKLAIDKEHEASEMYTGFAQKTTEPELKQLFENFANVELSHFRKLKELYAKMKETD